MITAFVPQAPKLQEVVIKITVSATLPHTTLIRLQIL